MSKEIDKERAIKLYEKGLGTIHVAFILGISQSTLYNKFKEWGVKTRKRGTKWKKLYRKAL